LGTSSILADRLGDDLVRLVGSPCQRLMACWRDELYWGIGTYSYPANRAEALFAR